MSGPRAQTVALTRPGRSDAPPPVPAPAPAAPVLARGSDTSITLARARRRRPAELVPGGRAGAWRVEHELGVGGMATVYAVVHGVFGKRAALKLAHRTILSDQFTPATFLREARIANLVEHPCMPDVFATGRYDLRPYLVMERLAGQTLGARLDAGPMPRDEGIAVLRELCEVLAAAHAAGVIHRDLKLDNVFLLARPGVDGHRVKLLDWGLSTIAGEPDPLSGMIAGTLTYVAPEQIRGEPVTPATDLYALAVLAYQVLLGQPPFAAVVDKTLLQLHLTGTPPSPRAAWPDIPPDLASLLVGLLAKRAADRPQLEEVAQVLTSAHAAVRAPAPRPHPPARLPTGEPLGRPWVALPGVHHPLLGVALAAAVTAASLAAWW